MTKRSFRSILVLHLVGSTGWCNGSTKDFGPFCLGSNPNPVMMMPCSTTVVQNAVNIEVVGSNPTGAAFRKNGRVV